MPIPTFTKLPPDPSFSDVASKMNALVGEMTNLLLSLDTLNVASLNAEVIEANTITADKMDVTELSAITANMGTITAGLLVAVNVIGSYIATANGTYPRCEMSATNNLFAVFSDADNAIRMIPFFTNGKPAILFQNGDTSLGSLTAPDAFEVSAQNELKLISGFGPISLHTDSLDGVEFDNWGELRNVDTGHNLKQDLDAKADLTALAGKATAGASTSSGGSYSVTLNGGIPI